MNFIGRKRESKLLQQWIKRHPSGQLTVIYGRRRVGKTRLVLETFKDTKLLRFEGLEGHPTAVQQRHFLGQLAEVTGRPEFRSVKATNWTDILGFLADYVEAETKRSNMPLVIFFDEFQWMCAERVDLVSRLKFLWDGHLSACPVHLILCGSVSSFLVKKVVHSKALYGRIHLEIDLQPMEIRDVAEFFPKRSLREVIELYMALGGIPQYLELVDPARSTLLNLQDLCFTQHGFLVNEYERLLVSHFGRVPHYQAILETLVRRKIASRDQLAKACQLESGGSLSLYLDELELAGFIERYVPLGRSDDSKINRYRLADAYLLFYFQFIRPALKQIRSAQELPLSRFLPDKQLAPWRELAFERICRKHAYVVAERLGFSAVSYDAGSWFQRADSDPGAQIDLMFVRADRVVTLCEVKYREEKIGKGVIKEVEAKIATYPNPKRMSIEPVLITASDVTQDVLDSGFFTRILTIEDVWGN
jgi:AAA+ ATPase superfamily predicted ATPase